MKVKEILDIAKKDELVFDSVYDTFDDVVDGKITLEEYNNSFKVSKLDVLWNIFVTPILFVHELFHIIFGLLIGKRINYVSFSKITNVNYHAEVSFENPLENSLLTSILVNLSPILIWIISFSLIFLNTYFIILFVYVVITKKYSLPSRIDILKVVLYKYKKEFETDELYMKFGSYCSKFKVSELLN